MPLIGTAGHVDHGKSTLIERLTGRDPDRWQEEKRRGLTIDLGFAWAELPDGTEVSFVDVPGHERFLKNMLAGIEAIDVALFVVAADEGWKPQSEEHLAVLDLLDVTRGVVAVTKTDVADPELTTLATEEVAASLVGTSLASAPIIPVSAVTGSGIDNLLAAMTASLPPMPEDNGRPRLWVDRSFPISGAGTVVTGSLLDAGVSIDTQVEIYPTGQVGRVRSIQSHERSLDRAGPGRRVALNLAGVSHDEVGRGHMIGLPGQWISTDRIAVSLRPARFIEEIDRRGAYQLHIGSAATRAEIARLEEGTAIIRLAEGMPAAVGDRFILRDTGRQHVVGGGRVLDPAPGRGGKALAAAATVDPADDPDVIAGSLLAARGQDTLERLSAHSGGGHPGDGLVAGRVVIHSRRLNQLSSKARELVEAEHDNHPLRPGLPLATLSENLGVDQAIVEKLVEEGEDLERDGPDVKLKGHAVTLTEAEQQAWEAATARLGRGLAVPDESDLGIDQELIAAKVRSGDLVRIAPGLVYLAGQLDEIRKHLDACDGEFTVAEFRDVSGLTRKYAVPILEWTDKEGLTVRRGDLRRVR